MNPRFTSLFGPSRRHPGQSVRATAPTTKILGLSRAHAVIAGIVALLTVAMTMIASLASAATTYVTIFTSSTTPTSGATYDPQPVELGVKFTALKAGKVAGVRFYKYGQNTGTHTGTLWSSTGAKLAAATFSGETSSGWQQVTFATPVAVSANQTLVASYHTNVGYYADQENAFANGTTLGNSSLRASAGLYRYGSTGFPTSSWHASNYYVDVLFAPTATTTTSSSAPAPAPVTSSTSSPAPSTSSSSTSGAFPTASTTGVPAGTALRAVPGSVTSGPGWTWNGSAVQVTASGTVLNGLDINGAVVGNSNLVIENSKVRCTNEANWCVSLGSGSTISHTEIGGGSNGTTMGTAIGVWTGGPNNVLDAVNIHHTSDGLRVDGGTTVKNSYIHDLSFASGVHSDGSQSTQAGGPVVFDHNTIVGGNNDCIFNQASNAFTVTNNLLLVGSGSSGISSYGVGGGGSPVVGPVTIKNNVFSKGFQVGPYETGSWPSGTVISGNTYQDGSAA